MIINGYINPLMNEHSRVGALYQPGIHIHPEALLILMHTKNYNSITIGQITDKAGVNRSTYYRKKGMSISPDDFASICAESIQVIKNLCCYKSEPVNTPKTNAHRLLENSDCDTVILADFNNTYNVIEYLSKP